MKKTKIICTMGPSTNKVEIIEDMIKSGMNVARINMSHGTHEENQPYINLVKTARENLKIPVALMVDTKGPEIRIGTFANPNGITLKKNQIFTVTTNSVEGNENIVSCNYKNLHKDVKVNNYMFINDGIVKLKITKIDGNDIITRVINEGKLTNRKSMFIPRVTIHMPFLGDIDKKDLLFAVENDADYIAASFVNCKNDVVEMREFLDENGGENIKIIAKIESVKGVKNIKEILEISDGIMVARGDLGVEYDFALLPLIQKDLIKMAKKQGKLVITATEMLESMIEKTRPTRAETTDVANAIIDETSAIMLSGETSVGKNPVLVVKTMAKIALSAEKGINYKKFFNNIDFNTEDITQASSHACCRLSFDINAKAIVVWTFSGRTARYISRFKPSCPIIAVCKDKKIFNQLAIHFGTIPVMEESFKTIEEMFEKSVSICKQLKLAAKNDYIVIACGANRQSNDTNLLKVTRI